MHLLAQMLLVFALNRRSWQHSNHLLHCVAFLAYNNVILSLNSTVAFGLCVYTMWY